MRALFADMSPVDCERTLYAARTAGDSAAITAQAAGGGPRKPRNAYEEFCRVAARLGCDWQALPDTLRRSLVSSWCAEADDPRLADYLSEATAYLNTREVRPLVWGLLFQQDRGAFGQLFGAALQEALRPVIERDIEGWRENT